MEKLIADAVGPVEYMSANHHGWIDAMGDYFVTKTKPQVYVLQVNHITHLNFESIGSMSSEKLYSGLRYIIPTALPELSKEYLGDEVTGKLTGKGGHVVIKVAAGGRQFNVYILNNDDEKFTISEVLGPFESR